VEEEPVETPEQRRTAWLLIGLSVVVVLALVVPLLVAVLRPSTAAETQETLARPEPPPPPTVTRPAATTAAVPTSGRELFVENCAGCHTLAAAETEGFGGPNLDELKPSRRRVLAAIRRGGSGNGVMPPDLVVGRDAQRVARFVSQATHR
jgi:mono/diheme cytochrome c family protein